MTDSEPMTSYQKIKTYLEDSSACQEALQPLRKDVDIGLTLDDGRDYVVTREAGSFQVLDRPPKKQDVQFSLSNEAVDRLLQVNAQSIAEISIQLCKEVKNRQVKIKVSANLLSLLKNGYLEVIAKGGKPLWAHLSQHGITSPRKIIAIFKDMIRKA